MSGLSPMERGATWTYLTTDQPFGSMQERFIRGAIAKIKEHRNRKAAYLKATNLSGHSNPETIPTTQKRSGRETVNRFAGIILTLVLGSLMWLRREHMEAMLRAVHYPLLASFGLWIAFTLYWSRASIGDSTIVHSESRGSRFIHEILLNTAFLLLFLQIFRRIFQDSRSASCRHRGYSPQRASFCRSPCSSSRFGLDFTSGATGEESLPFWVTIN